jgi:MYXO-CTERM domain-containing protein
MDWIEDVSGETLPRPQCNAAPQVEVAPLVVEAGEEKVVDVTVTDDGPGWSAEMVSPPAHGTVTVDGQGVVWFEADEGYEGGDAFTVDIVDNGGSYGQPASTRVTVDVTIVAPGEGGASPEGFDIFGDEDPDSMLADDGDEDLLHYRRLGRSCSTGSSAPSGAVALLALLALRRRQRR